ncbi:MAG: HTTM domain-containing protein [Acidimicrobiales bacterium]
MLWALAAVWHLLGNTVLAPAWAQALLCIGVGLVLIRPGAPLPLGVLAAAGLLTVWEEAPLLGNHWLLAGGVNLVIVMAIVVGALRRRVTDRTDLADRLFPAARLCVLIFYGFAAFAKLNTAFLDRAVSCAVFYFNESTESIGLSGVHLASSSPLAWVVIVVTLVVELSIPVLLLMRRTRAVGVVVGLCFHAVLALDQTHQFFDFSAVLFALFVLFLPPTAGTWVAERVGSMQARLALRSEALPGRVQLILVGVPVTVGLLVAVDVLTPALGVDVGWWPWQLYAVAVIGTSLAFLRQHRDPSPHCLRPHHALFVIVPLLVVANGLTPYLELKTGYGWNMYANLRTVDGETNHLIVRRTLPLTDEQVDPVRILDTNSAALARYAATDYGLTWRQLRDYLAEHPRTRITYQRGSQVVALQEARDRPELVEPVPEWREKLQLFRAIDLQDPERCLVAFGPAR